jgi:hypothetical protein
MRIFMDDGSVCPFRQRSWIKRPITAKGSYCEEAVGKTKGLASCIHEGLASQKSIREKRADAEMWSNAILLGDASVMLANSLPSLDVKNW